MLQFGFFYTIAAALLLCSPTLLLAHGMGVASRPSRLVGYKEPGERVSPEPSVRMSLHAVCKPSTKDDMLPATAALATTLKCYSRQSYCWTRLTTSTQFVPIITTKAAPATIVPPACVQVTVTSYIDSVDTETLFPSPTVKTSTESTGSVSKSSHHTSTSTSTSSMTTITTTTTTTTTTTSVTTKDAVFSFSCPPPVTIFRYRTRIQTATLPIEYTRRLWLTTTKTSGPVTVSVPVPMVETETLCKTRIATLPIYSVHTVHVRSVTTRWKTLSPSSTPLSSLPVTTLSFTTLPPWLPTTTNHVTSSTSSSTSSSSWPFTQTSLVPIIPMPDQIVNTTTTGQPLTTGSTSSMTLTTGSTSSMTLTTGSTSSMTSITGSTTTPSSSGPWVPSLPNMTMTNSSSTLTTLPSTTSTIYTSTVTVDETTSCSMVTTTSTLTTTSVSILTSTSDSILTVTVTNFPTSEQTGSTFPYYPPAYPTDSQCKPIYPCEPTFATPTFPMPMPMPFPTSYNPTSPIVPVKPSDPDEPLIPCTHSTNRPTCGQQKTCCLDHHQHQRCMLPSVTDISENIMAMKPSAIHNKVHTASFGNTVVDFFG